MRRYLVIKFIQFGNHRKIIVTSLASPVNILQASVCVCVCERTPLRLWNVLTLADVQTSGPV